MDSNPYTPPQGPIGVMAPSTAKPHSRLGIASFAIGLMAMALELGTIIAVVAVVVTMRGHPPPPLVKEATPIALFVGLLGSLAAVILGVAALFQRDRKRLFSILGIIVSGATIAFMLCLLAIALIWRAR